MRTDIVLTLTGPDRVGIVEEVTRELLALDGNVETSRMARLGGEFAMLMLVSLPDDAADAVETALGHLTAEGYLITVRRTAAERPADDTVAYRIEVRGADHEGIIHDFAARLSSLGINIESMDTGTAGAPITGTPLFFMSAVVAVPRALLATEWTADLEEAGRAENVDVTVVRQTADVGWPPDSR